MIVALVPGLEFCNHSPRPNATWALEETQSADKPPEYVSLMSAPSVGLRKHQEVLIDYGDKSNEELLFHYGFVVEDNPQDALMMHYELPAEDKCVSVPSRCRLQTTKFMVSVANFASIARSTERNTTQDVHFRFYGISTQTRTGPSVPSQAWEPVPKL